jgi:hypothetical protein
MKMGHRLLRCIRLMFSARGESAGHLLQHDLDDRNFCIVGLAEYSSEDVMLVDKSFPGIV